MRRQRETTDEEVGRETGGMPTRQDVAREGLLPACPSEKGLQRPCVGKAAAVVEERWFGGQEGTHLPGITYICWFIVCDRRER